MTGLKPYEQYYYRFATRDEESPVGRFRTALPPDSNQPVRFAFFSCQDFTFGYFNAHALLAKEDLDFVVYLGDYIYAEDYYPVGAAPGGVRDDPVGTVGDARSVPGQVRRLPHRPEPAARARPLPDDHHLGRPRGAGQLRRRRGPDRRPRPAARLLATRASAAGYQAFFESLPTFGAKRGSTADLPGRALRPQRGPVLLRPRQYRDDQPCGDPCVGPACAELEQPRKYLGRSQMNFVKKRLASSGAAWKVRRQPADDHADLLPRRGRSSTSTRGWAIRRSARSCSATSSARRSRTWCSSPATSTRSSPATCA